MSVCQAVIFVNSKNKANYLGAKLIEDGNTVGVIHSEIPDIDRRDVLTKFRTGGFRILVATDIIGRGIDVQQVGLIINYDVPKESEQYIHRVGRSGRFGKIGVAISLVTNYNNDIRRMMQLERKYKIKFYELPDLKVVNDVLTSFGGYTSRETTGRDN